MENKNRWKTTGVFCALVSLGPLVLGLCKMPGFKAYVGGDTYSYIINAGYATAYFVLAGTLLLAGIGCGVLYYLSNVRFQAPVKPVVQEYPDDSLANQYGTWNIREIDSDIEQLQIVTIVDKGYWKLALDNSGDDSSLIDRGTVYKDQEKIIDTKHGKFLYLKDAFAFPVQGN